MKIYVVGALLWLGLMCVTVKAFTESQAQDRAEAVAHEAGAHAKLAELATLQVKTGLFKDQTTLLLRDGTHVVVDGTFSLWRPGMSVSHAVYAGMSFVCVDVQCRRIAEDAGDGFNKQDKQRSGQASPEARLAL
ncbi:hypothetical protein OR449_002328 [Salmonella enterica subsp. enterica serovar Montevideo]|nr:hypothetical protein [Salmonella enterica]EKD5436169.1 hypothetical protein [Salmonella enterica subsp. enterica serovar Montevideo]